MSYSPDTFCAGRGMRDDVGDLILACQQRTQHRRLVGNLLAHRVRPLAH